MASMSYCKFENTAIDLTQCMNAMEEADCFGDLDNSSHETYAMIRIFDTCSEFIKQYKRLQELGGPIISK